MCEDKLFSNYLLLLNSLSSHKGIAIIFTSQYPYLKSNLTLSSSYKMQSILYIPLNSLSWNIITQNQIWVFKDNNNITSIINLLVYYNYV